MVERVSIPIGVHGEEVLIEGDKAEDHFRLERSPVDGKIHLGVHPGCDGKVQIVDISPFNQALICTGCFLRLVLPNNQIQTTGRLKSLLTVTIQTLREKKRNLMLRA